MEPIFQAHPIPQNVTNFEFHLVGDMTLKQFGYLAAGLGFAFLIFTTLSTVLPIVAWPIIVISSLLGTAFAFLPIQDRPLDHWVAAFFRAIFKPTSLKYSSKILNPNDPFFSKRLTHYLNTQRKVPIIARPLPPLPEVQANALKKPEASLGQKKQSFIDKFKAGQTNFAAPAANQGTAASVQGIVKNQTQPVPTTERSTLHPLPYSSPAPGIMRNPEVISKLPDLHAIPKPQPPALPESPVVTNSADLKKTVELAKNAQENQKEIVKIEASLAQIKQQAAQPGVDPKTYIEQFEDLLTELQKLNEKSSQNAKELAAVSNLPVKPQTPATPIKAKSIPTLKLTSFPNVINGIVTDSLGNYLEGSIVVAHDKQGLPVRALKSNKLGQFVAATPLPNGEYTIVIEKDTLVFDKVSIELTNEILPPILVAAKKLQQGTE